MFAILGIVVNYGESWAGLPDLGHSVIWVTLFDFLDKLIVKRTSFRSYGLYFNNVRDYEKFFDAI